MISGYKSRNVAQKLIALLARVHFVVTVKVNNSSVARVQHF